MDWPLKDGRRGRGRITADRVAEVITFAYVVEKCCVTEIPKKSPQTQRANMRELSNLLAFFNAPPVALDASSPCIFAST